MRLSEVFFEIGLNHYLILAAILFAIGMAGVFFRKNIIVILMSVELMLNSVNLTFIALSKYMGNLDGQIMVCLYPVTTVVF
jgi:NADH-quinone oxidoreductase subunit K